MKNKKVSISVLLLAALLPLLSCRDFIEVNLEKKSVTILAPANNTVSSNYTQLFKWEEVKGAEQYQLQIVKPNFSTIQQFVLDTNTYATQFSYTLQPGTYQWRLRAKNNSSNTPYVTYTITIDSTLNLASQAVVLTSPADNYFTKTMTQMFTWQTMPNANSYVFQIVVNGSVISTQSPTLTTANYTFAAEGTYQWRVFAQNNQSSSAYSERTITIDTTNPSVPVITFIPLNDSTNLDPVPLSWNGVEPDAKYRILISPDSTFTGILKDTVTSDLSYNFYNSTLGQFYYWKVGAIDQVGNVGLYSNRKRFKRE